MCLASHFFPLATDSLHFNHVYYLTYLRASLRLVPNQPVVEDQVYPPPFFPPEFKSSDIRRGLLKRIPTQGLFFFLLSLTVNIV